MDTNVLNALLNALSQQQQPANNTLAITALVLTSLAGLIASIMGYVKARTSLTLAEETKVKAVESHAVAEAAKVVSDKTAENVQKIEISVNSERTSLLKKFDEVVAELGLVKTESALSKSKFDGVVAELGSVKNELALSKQALLDEIKKQS